MQSCEINKNINAKTQLKIEYSLGLETQNYLKTMLFWEKFRVRSALN